MLVESYDFAEQELLDRLGASIYDHELRFAHTIAQRLKPQIEIQ